MTDAPTPKIISHSPQESLLLKGSTIDPKLDTNIYTPVISLHQIVQEGVSTLDIDTQNKLRRDKKYELVKPELYLKQGIRDKLGLQTTEADALDEFTEPDKKPEREVVVMTLEEIGPDGQIPADPRFLRAMLDSRTGNLRILNEITKEMYEHHSESGLETYRRNVEGNVTPEGKQSGALGREEGGGVPPESRA